MLPICCLDCDWFLVDKNGRPLPPVGGKPHSSCAYATNRSNADDDDTCCGLFPISLLDGSCLFVGVVVVLVTRSSRTVPNMDDWWFGAGTTTAATLVVVVVVGRSFIIVKR